MEFMMDIKTYDRQQVLQSKLNMPHICKYCRRRFFLYSWPRYRSHLAHHELRYLPYFFMRKPDNRGNSGTESARVHQKCDINNNEVGQTEMVKTFDDSSRRSCQDMFQSRPTKPLDLTTSSARDGYKVHASHDVVATSINMLKPMVAAANGTSIKNSDNVECMQKFSTSQIECLKLLSLVPVSKELPKSTSGEPCQPITITPNKSPAMCNPKVKEGNGLNNLVSREKPYRSPSRSTQSVDIPDHSLTSHSTSEPMQMLSELSKQTAIAHNITAKSIMDKHKADIPIVLSEGEKCQNEENFLSNKARSEVIPVFDITECMISQKSPHSTSNPILPAVSKPSEHIAFSKDNQANYVSISEKAPERESIMNMENYDKRQPRSSSENHTQRQIGDIPKEGRQHLASSQSIQVSTSVLSVPSCKMTVKSPPDCPDIPGEAPENSSFQNLVNPSGSRIDGEITNKPESPLGMSKVHPPALPQDDLCKDSEESVSMKDLATCNIQVREECTNPSRLSPAQSPTLPETNKQNTDIDADTEKDNLEIKQKLPSERKKSPKSDTPVTSKSAERSWVDIFDKSQKASGCDKPHDTHVPSLPTDKTEQSFTLPNEYPKLCLKRLVLSKSLLDTLPTCTETEMETSVKTEKDSTTFNLKVRIKDSRKATEKNERKKSKSKKHKDSKNNKSKHKRKSRPKTVDISKLCRKRLEKHQKKPETTQSPSAPSQSNTNATPTEGILNSNVQPEVKKLSLNTALDHEAKHLVKVMPEYRKIKRPKKHNTSYQEHSPTIDIKVRREELVKPENISPIPGKGYGASVAIKCIPDIKNPPELDDIPFDTTTTMMDIDSDNDCKDLMKHISKRPYNYIKRKKPSKSVLYDFSVKAKREDAENPYHICKYCNKVFPKASSRKIHELIHTNSRPYKCNYCDRTFTQNSNRRSHEKIHTGVTRSYACKFCERKFPCNSKRTQHEKMHNVGILPFIEKHTCEICDKTFASNSAIRKHYRTHTGERPYKCNFCDKTFSQRGNMRIHELIHIGARNFVCKVCKKDFLRKNDLRMHAMIHRGEKPFPCRYCGRCFSQGSHRASHERGHSNDRPYHCKFCPMAFSRNDTRKAHEMVHQGIKPHKCSFCDKAFVLSSDKTIHERIHTKIRPYNCAYCEKTFTTSSTKTIHERVHTNEKPFQCYFCKEAFATGTKRKRHCYQVHTDEDLDGTLVKRVRTIKTHEPMIKLQL